MPGKNQGTTVQAMLEARLRWALESTLSHFLHRPNRNTIEDWAADTARDLCGEDLSTYIRVLDSQRSLPPGDAVPASSNGSKAVRPT